MLQSREKKKIIRSIGELGRRVTAADVSTKTGLPVLLVSQALNQIASETGGHLLVTSNGSLLYSFSPGFSNRYLTQGLRRFLERAFDGAFSLLFFVLRISFGIMLIVSFSIIVMTFFILFFAQRGAGGKNKRSFDAGERFNNFLNYMIIRDLFFYFGSSKSKSKYDYDKPSIRRPEQANFLFDCFSFLFGDGDPNEGLEEKRWQLIAKVIKQHDNVVTSEQLAPYTGAAPGDEDAVLPVLVRFGGSPEVTENGNIVYVFPSLAVSGKNPELEPVPSFLCEFHWKFSEASEEALKPVYCIAFLNFFGSWFLWFLLHSSSAPSITGLFNLLVSYGSLFLIVPFFRYLVIEFLNRRIDKRNASRALAAENLQVPDIELRAKIAESREYRLRAAYISKADLAYSTEKAYLEQDGELEAELRPGDSFDARPDKTFDANPPA